MLAFMTRARGHLAVACLAFMLAGCSHLQPYQATAPIDPGPSPEPVYRLLLAGDAGEADNATLAALRAEVGRRPDRSLVVFLGDNAYPEGLTEARRTDAEARIERQLAVVANTAAEALFVPGNHDWADGGPHGLPAVLAQQAFVSGRARFLPRDGCPGPVAVDLPAADPAVRVVALDTQWWLHDGPTGMACEPAERSLVLEQLARALETDLPIVVAAHHPLVSYGPHSGFYDWRTHVFPLRGVAGWLWVPLPGVGSIYPLFRRLSLRDQDLGDAENATMRQGISDALATHDGPGFLLYAAGHEHSLQVLRSEVADLVVVSGAASRAKVTPVSSGPDTLIAHEHPGFMVLDVTRSGARLSVVEPVTAGARETVFMMDLPMTRDVSDVETE